MQIVVNDERIECEQNMPIAALLLRLELDKPGIALALNQHILPRAQWQHHSLQEGDALLIFQAIAGG